MYVTRPLSLYRNFPTSLSVEPPEGPHTGYLVITDEEAEAEETFCWGVCKSRRVRKLPFPQDKILTLFHLSGYEETTRNKVWFLPVLDQPLSSNYYYVIKAKGRRKGQAYTCSREINMGLCCIKNFINSGEPKPFDHRNMYQIFKIHRHHQHSFFSRSLAPDGYPPKFLRRKGWELRSSKICKPQLSDALGLDTALRAQLPSINFPICMKTSPSVVVGNWYCPFVFVSEEDARLSEQMEKSILYKMTLEQYWQEIYSCENVNNEGNVVRVNVNVQREVDSVYGKEAIKENGIGHGGFIWYRSRNRNNRGRGCNVGLSLATIEKMKWVREEGGWFDGEESNERVERIVEIRSEDGWSKFGCYMLVEKFVLRRMDGSLVLRCDFRHTDKIQCKCE